MKEAAFQSRVVRAESTGQHYLYLLAPDGDWLGVADGRPATQGYVDDNALWSHNGNEFVHVVTRLRLSGSARPGGRLRHAGAELGVDGSPVADGQGAVFAAGHGPERLPSEYLHSLRENGWVALTHLLAPDVVDGLQKLGCVDDHELRTPQRDAPQVVQDPALARATAEPLTAWLCRQYMATNDITLGHPPSVSALTPDDGQRPVQGWHTDFPYLWGTGDRVPVQNGVLTLGMQRNVCVSDFRKENGATVFKLGTHRQPAVPPRAWGISNDTYRPGHREQFGLPYGGPDTEVIEAPAGTIILYDARTWHRAGVNLTQRKRGAIVQAIVPGFIMPFMDVSATFKAYIESMVPAQLSARERRDLEKLMLHRISGPAGLFAITTDAVLTERVRALRAPARSSAY